MRRIFYLLIFLPLVGFAQFNTDRLVMIGRSALYYEDYVLSIQYFNQAISQKHGFMNLGSSVGWPNTTLMIIGEPRMTAPRPLSVIHT